MLLKLVEQGVLEHIDAKLAAFIAPTNKPIAMIVALLSKALREQHTGLSLADINRADPFQLSDSQLVSEFCFDPQSDFYQLLEQSGLINEHGPLSYQFGYVYFSRYAAYEQILAEAFTARSQTQTAINNELLKQLLDLYFAPSQELDWQKVACAVAVLKPFSVISGGPGTGKTTTVTKLLAILQSLNRHAPLNIALVAPTGKAAARLGESIAEAKARLKHSEQLNDDIAKTIPEHAKTLHRLLGVIPHSNQFKHNKNNPINYDLVLVDEGSMVDLAMFAKLVDAVPKHAKIVILGDKDQLASVEAGNVLGELCSELTLGVAHTYSNEFATLLNVLTGYELTVSHSQFVLNDNLAYLQKSHRFDGASGIGRLAKAVNSGDITTVKQLLNGQTSDISWYPLELGYKVLMDKITQPYEAYFNELDTAQSIADIHKAFTQYQVLAAVKKGNYGVDSINQVIEANLASKGIINLGKRIYHGMPIMITANDYQLNVFNGDIGIMVLQNEKLFASFIDQQTGNVRLISVAQLPSYEKVYAMTIHKSQGSEFNTVCMLLPPKQQAHQGIDRQLVYTGITRAKQRFELVAQQDVVIKAMRTELNRNGTLYKRLCKS